jgi:putative hydrolase of the HAD superfamily
LHGYFDAVICSHDLGLPKEDRDFWDKLQQVEPFEKQRTLFVDDSQSVLESAREYGMGYLVRVLYPDTKGPVREPGGFEAIHDFSEIIP